MVGGPFTLTDHTGKRVTDQDFRGRTLLGRLRLHVLPGRVPIGAAGGGGGPRQARTRGAEQVASRS